MSQPNMNNHPMCGLHGVNVVISQYNKNGECRCLKCGPCPMYCQSCSRYKQLLKEADLKMQMRLERCISCMNQK